MGMMTSERERKLFGLSPWLLIGVSLILGLAVLFFALRITMRDERRNSVILLERAGAVIRALEAGARTWQGHEGDRNIVQALVDETAKQPGILHLAVVRLDGLVLAHSDQSKTGTYIDKADMPPLDDPYRTQWRIVGDKADPVFEAYRLFAPSGGDDGHHGRGMGHMRMMGGRGMGMGMGMGRGMGASITATDQDSLVLVGLDQRPFREALAADFHNTFMLAALIAALGLAGLVSMFWAHNYRRSRRMLADVRAMSSEVIGSLPMGLITCDAQGNIEVANSVAQSMLGQPAELLARRKLAEIPSLDWRPILEELDRGGRVLEREEELTASDGRITPVRVSASCIRDGDGALLGYVLILGDIGEVRRLQGEVQRNERLTALGNLAAGVAHEIRNPLSTIKGLATYMARRMPKGEREDEAAATMITEVSRLNEVVSELLEFARPAVTKGEPDDVNAAIRRSLRLADADIKARKITVAFEPDDDAPAIRLNQERFVQALLNLILNAVQAMEEHGVLGIATRRDSARRELAITVSDNGAGMAEEVRKAIFNPYFTTKPGGTGLGLAIAHQIVEAHDGRISVKSAPGMGSAFTIHLPLGNF